MPVEIAEATSELRLALRYGQRQHQHLVAERANLQRRVKGICHYAVRGMNCRERDPQERCAFELCCADEREYEKLLAALDGKGTHPLLGIMQELCEPFRECLEVLAAPIKIMERRLRNLARKLPGREVRSAAKYRGELWGSGGIYLRGRTWWVHYSVRSKVYRKSAQTTKRSEAVEVLKRAVANRRTAAKLVAERTSLAAMFNDLDARVQGDTNKPEFTEASDGALTLAWHDGKLVIVRKKVAA